MEKDRIKEADNIIREWLYNESIIDRTEQDNAELAQIKLRARKFIVDNAMEDDDSDELAAQLGKFQKQLIKIKGIFIDVFICDGVTVGNRKGWAFLLRNVRSNELIDDRQYQIYDSYLEALIHGVKEASDYDEERIH